ncbi:MAG: hypothetical protein UW73_C0041G0002 [Microgenomates group bacterium GW2011_GWB1_44_8]|nr:MAG: hypothetical protein UW73_C0041G0002 [Microgenomates group bacterium GW2011_GWB1_44_8]
MKKSSLSTFFRKNEVVHKKKTRILMLYDFPLKGGGSGAYVKYLSLRLQEKGYEVAIALPDKQKVHKDIKQYYLKLPQIPVFISRPGLEGAKKYSQLTNKEITDLYFALLKGTINAVEDFKPDIINVHHAMLNSWVARYMRSLYNIKFVVTSHGSCLNAIAQDKRYFRLTRDALRAANAITVVSGDTKAKLIHMFHSPEISNKIRTIPGGVKWSLFSERKTKASLAELAHKYHIQKDRVVLFSGRLISEKGVEYLVKAAPKIRGQIVIAGDGPRKENLAALIASKKIQNVNFLGYIDHELLIKIYYLADVFVSPSVWDDPMPLTIVEAMAAGLPVVVTRRGGIPLAVKDNYNGFFVKLRNPEDIVEKVNILLDNKELRKKMGERGRKIVKEKFIWTKIAERFHNLFKII